MAHCPPAWPSSGTVQIHPDLGGTAPGARAERPEGHACRSSRAGYRLLWAATQQASTQLQDLALHCLPTAQGPPDGGHSGVLTAQPWQPTETGAPGWTQRGVASSFSASAVALGRTRPQSPAQAQHQPPTPRSAPPQPSIPPSPTPSSAPPQPASAQPDTPSQILGAGQAGSHPGDLPFLKVSCPEAGALPKRVGVYLAPAPSRPGRPALRLHRAGLLSSPTPAAAALQTGPGTPRKKGLGIPHSLLAPEHTSQ